MSAAELLADLARHNVRLDTADGMLLYYPRSAVTPEMLGRMKEYKADLLAILQSKSSVKKAPAHAAVDPVEMPETMRKCKCGCRVFRDVPTHEGRSLRRDCRRCGFTAGFPVWYGGRYFV